MYACSGLGGYSASSAMTGNAGTYSLPPARSEGPRSEGFNYCPGQTLKMTAQLQLGEPAQLQLGEPLNWSAPAGSQDVLPPPGLSAPAVTSEMPPSLKKSTRKGNYVPPSERPPKNKVIRPPVEQEVMTQEADSRSEPDVPHSSSASTADTEPAGGLLMAGPVLNPAEVPTRGSAGHGLGACKPCAFVYKDGCQSGFECQFCHICPPGEKIRRKKELKQRRKLNKTTKQ
ncbi:unnamed protein product [Symbiodinium sp. CCMP2456]|nr:unnamed protein product [Symbiodinium sp. CCMP2456]